MPCLLMGATFPLLARILIDTQRNIGRRIGLLYSWNTFGAAAGCSVTACWLLDRVGQRETNLWVVGTTGLVGLIALRVSKQEKAGELSPLESGAERNALRANTPSSTSASNILLRVAFLNGLAGLTCEVAWFRYLDFLIFLGQPAYVFPMILCIYLVGLGCGGFVFQWSARRWSLSFGALCVTEMLLGLVVLSSFFLSGLIFSSGPPPPIGFKGVALLAVFPPTILMGFSYPLVCSLYNNGIEKMGSGIGVFVAFNTVGALIGAVLPVFVLIPLFGIQGSLVAASAVFLLAGVSLSFLIQAKRLRFVGTAFAGVAASVLLMAVVPGRLCERVFLSLGFPLAKHTDVLFYHEGRTGTAVVTQDRLNGKKVLYVNGNPEAPTLYADQLCFKLLGDLGPLLHPDPSDVLMVCFGGGIAAGATECLPEVKSVTVVDLEGSVIDAAHVLVRENNGVLASPKTHVVIDDGRNYIATSSRKWPVIITDSTHPKAPDSWVLYSKEFYHEVESRLTEDGVFVQWVPFHDLSVEEYKIILRTFQSVFPHTSLWIADAMNERGQFITYTLLVGTPRALKIDALRLETRLSESGISRDLEPYGMNRAAGVLDTFLCGEDKLRQWVGDGPVNTDDLPFTYYITRYARGQKMGNGILGQLSETIEPLLLPTGSERWRSQLGHELNLRRQANRAALAGDLRRAFMILPSDPRMRRMSELYQSASAYVDAMAELFKDDTNGLLYTARLGVPGSAAYRSSRRIYERVLGLDPNNVEALNMLGCMCSESAEFTQAYEYFDRAVRLDPHFANAHYNLGNWFFRDGQLGRANDCYSEALRLDPENVEAEINLGSLKLQQGQVEDAIACYQKAIAMKPDSLDAAYNLALAFSRSGNRRQAMVYYEKALELKADDPALLNEFAWQLATSPENTARNAPKALELAQRANQLTDGSIPLVLRTLAAAYAGTGAYSEARENLQKAISLARLEGNLALVEQLDDDLSLYEARAARRFEN
ncbi:MAG TPA: fused MFS/spermidine synthase [Opitutaceae bacterium]